MAQGKKKDVNEGWEERIIQIENQFRNELREKIQESEEKYEKSLRNLENKWEEKYRTKIEEMENRYINTFGNLKKSQQQNSENRKGEAYRGPTMDIAKPLFYGNRKDTHPIDFLDRLEEYLAVKQIVNTDEKLIIARDCLKTAARNWFTTIKFQIDNYQGFRHTFKDEYWSREIQMQTWSQCLNIRQVLPETNYREHFSYWATKLRHLEVPRLAEAEIVRNIAGHYPGYLRAMLISLSECTILNAMRILGTEEHRRPLTRESNNYGSTQPQNKKNNPDCLRQLMEDQPRRERNWNHRPPPSDDHQRDNQTNKNNHYNDKSRRDPGQNNDQQWRERQRINQVNVEEINSGKSGEENITNHTINNISTSNTSGSPYVRCAIEGESVTVLVDTGVQTEAIKPDPIQQAKAFARYQRQAAARITRYHLESTIQIPYPIEITDAEGRQIKEEDIVQNELEIIQRAERTIQGSNVVDATLAMIQSKKGIPRQEENEYLQEEHHHACILLMEGKEREKREKLYEKAELKKCDEIRNARHLLSEPQKKANTTKPSVDHASSYKGNSRRNQRSQYTRKNFKPS